MKKIIDLFKIQNYCNHCGKFHNLSDLIGLLFMSSEYICMTCNTELVYRKND